MEFRIADTFTESLAHLTGEEQKSAKTTAFDLQLDPSSSGHSFHKLDRAKDKNFWSVRVSRDIRMIVHRTTGSLLLCYVDHHDKAYAWAERRKLETHPKTGAAQLVEIREVVREVEDYTRVTESRAAYPDQRLFANVTEQDLLGFGVPMEWLHDVREATDDTLLALTDHLPAEAAEALLELATGGKPQPKPLPVPADPFAHPDAQRRFRVVADVDELARALEYPWDKWTIFLHPAQRELIERSFGGPARISGSAGTGKTIVALHRAAFLARRNPEARVLLTTFSDTLASVLRTKLHRLISGEPRVGERIEVAALDAIAERLHNRMIRPAQIASAADVRKAIAESASQEPEQRFSLGFLASEWDEVVDAWQLDSWETYRDIARLGRKRRLPEKQRQATWAVFDRVRATLKARGLLTRPAVYAQLAAHLRSGRLPYDFVVVDESQDLSVPQLRFLAALGGNRTDGLFFAGDLGQRIFQLPFSWKSLDVNIRGRSGTLRINYRTSHQIRAKADQLLGKQIADVDGNVEERIGTVSVFNGPEPRLASSATPDAEAEAIGKWLSERVSEGVTAEEIGVFVRSSGAISRAQRAVAVAELEFRVLDEDAKPARDRVSIGTMHLSKGLEFRTVVVMACDDDVLPSQERIQSVTDDGDLEEVYNTERHLLYVACTRARDHLLVSGVAPVSEFLHDLGALDT